MHRFLTATVLVTVLLTLVENSAANFALNSSLPTNFGNDECFQDDQVLRLTLSKPLGLMLQSPILNGEPSNGVVVSSLVDGNPGSAHSLSPDFQKKLVGSRIVAINNESTTDLFINEVVDRIINTNQSVEIVFDTIARNETTPSSWDELLRSGDSIVANGNVWPPQPNDHRNNCLLLATHSQIIRNCPFAGDDEEGTYEVLYKHHNRRFRGIFAASITHPGDVPSKPRRLWLLSSPLGTSLDLLEELDTELGRIVQTVRVPGTIDGHDAVRFENSVFVVDTRHGDIVEVALPESMPIMDDLPIQDEELVQNEDRRHELQVAEVIHRHSGYTRVDHVNNVAVHRDVLLASLHGGDKLKKKIKEMHGGMQAPTRLSVLRRDLSAAEVMDEGFRAVENAGKWCHGIAFWQEKVNDDKSLNTVKLITLDSKSGSLVSVALSGPGSETRERTVLWKPDLSHPALRPPEGMSTGYKNGFVFAKGLAVQGGVAFFGVAGARQRAERLAINPTLLVAVDLSTGEELFVRAVQSHGLINQVVTESYLGYNANQSVQQESYRLETNECLLSKDEIMAMVEEEFPMLTTFDHYRSGERSICHDEHMETHQLPLYVKEHDVMTELREKQDPNKIVSYLCTLDVSGVKEKLMATWNKTWYDIDHERNTNARFENRGANMAKFKPGVKSAVLIFSDRLGVDVYHFPWLKEWLPVLQETILSPLRINLNNVVRMQMALMAPGSTINKHQDKGMWVKRTHRVHVPLITHNDTYFVTEIPKESYLRIPSMEGVVYELNNVAPHIVRNYGSDRVHLVIDWAEEPTESITRLEPGQVCYYGGNEGVICSNDNRYNHG